MKMHTHQGTCCKSPLIIVASPRAANIMQLCDAIYTIYDEIAIDPLTPHSTFQCQTFNGARAL